MSGRSTLDWLLGDVRAFAAAPHSFPWRIAQEGGGIGAFRVLHRHILATCDANVAHHVLVAQRQRWRRGKHNRNLGILIGDGLLASEGAPWKARHDMIQPLLRRNALASIAPIVQRATARRLVDWEARRRVGGLVAIVGETRRLAMEVIAEHLLSFEIDPEFGAHFGSQMSDAMLSLRRRNTSLAPAPMWAPTALNQKLANYRRELDTFLGAHVDARLASGAPYRTDMLGAMLDARDATSGARLSRSALINEAKTVFVAGYETAATTLTWTLLLLAQHPGVAARLHDELDAVLSERAPEWNDLPKLSYTLQIINESMRLFPAVYNIARECVADDNVNGRRIPRGTTMLISIYGLHRSSAWGDDVECFRPERFASEVDWPRRSFLPFGSGEHLCIGNNFAYAELLIAVAMIAQRFRLSCADDAPVEASARITLTPTRDFSLRLEPRR